MVVLYISELFHPVHICGKGDGSLEVELSLDVLQEGSSEVITSYNTQFYQLTGVLELKQHVKFNIGIATMTMVRFFFLTS